MPTGRCASGVGPAAIMILALSGAAGAQQAPPLPQGWAKVGDTVKVWSTNPPIRGARGVVRRHAGDTLVLGLRSAQSKVFLDTPLQTAAVARLDLLVGHRASAERKVAGTMLGFAAGLVVGGIIGRATANVSCDESSGDCIEFNTPEARRGFATFIGALGGAAIGSVLGAVAASNPQPIWRTVVGR